MIYKFSAILLIILTSCTKDYGLSNKNGIYFIQDLYSELDDAKEVDWSVGLNREVDISKGIRFYVDVPKINDNAINTLQEKYGVNSWIFRFQKIERGTKRNLGLYALRFKNISRNTKNFSVNLYYQAAAISKHFRNFHCPAFNHRYKVDNFGISPRPNSDTKDLYLRSIESVKSKVGELRFSPMILPGGLKLKGQYIVDVALYNTTRKQRFSEWFAVNGILNIQVETARTVTSCNGIKEENNPLPSSRLPNLKDFEIK